MPNKKNSDISDADLLEALNSPEKTIELETGKTPTKFLQAFNLQPGDKLLLRDYLYRVYIRWNKVDAFYRQRFYEEVSETLKYAPPYFAANISSKDFRENFIEPFNKSVPRKRKHDRKVAAFLRKYDIKSGHTPIEGFLLYFLYDRYLYERNYVTPSLLHFCDILKKQEFKCTQTKYGPVFFLHKNIYTFFTEQEVQNVREARRKEKDKKKHAKVSKPRS